VNADQRLDGVVEHSSLRIIDLDPQSDPRWETLMKTLPASVIYQHPAWLEVLEEACRYKPMHLACEDAAGNLRGILPLFYRKGLRTGRLCASLFDSPIAGPLADDDQARTMLIQAAIERTRAQGGAQFQLKSMSTGLDGLVDNVIGVPLFETYELALPERPDLLYLDSKIRRAVNKASRSDMQIRYAETIGELRTWYGLYLQTMRRLVAMPRPYRFFELAWRRLHPLGLLRLLLAEQVQAGHHRLIAGILLLQWGQTVSYSFAGWRREDQGLRPNDFLHWHAIRSACEEGMHWYDFGNVRVGDQGLVRFKSKWGAEAKIIYRYSYPTVPLVSHGTVRVPSQSRGSAVRRLVSPLWQHLPTKAIGLMGDWCHALHYY
jgi:CelD/BcsL family acetyltransferase involved in cellulose biosynthesis